jgi:hypothetical protein
MRPVAFLLLAVLPALAGLRAMLRDTPSGTVLRLRVRRGVSERSLALVLRDLV